MSAVCSNVTSDDCTAPANLRACDRPSRLPTCYRCGQSVCAACSSRRRTKNGRVRLCDQCLAYEPDGEAKVLLRRYHQAGYPKVTLAACRAEAAARDARFRGAA